MKKALKYFFKMSIVALAASFILLLTSCGSKSSSNSQKKTTIRMAFPTWVGYGPLYVAEKKGYFKDENLNVKLKIVEGLAERKQAMASGSLDGLATSADVITNLASKKEKLGIVWVLDRSNGADGIVVNKSIKNISDLKGKKVAVEVGSTEHLFLLDVLKANNMSDKDVKIVNMTTADAGSAFVAKKVPAAVTYDPYLTQAVDSGGKSYTTKDYPVQLVDVIGFSKKFIKNNPQAVKGFVKAMTKASNYVKEHPAKANKIMATGLKIKESSVKDTVSKLKMYNLKDNKKQFGKKGSNGTIYNTVTNISSFYVKQKISSSKVGASEIINPTFVRSLK